MPEKNKLFFYTFRVCSGFARVYGLYPENVDIVNNPYFVKYSAHVICIQQKMCS